MERYFKHNDVAVLLVFTALMGLLTLPFSAASLALIVLSGILYMGATLFYLHALQSDEASVVAPFFQTVPLFGYVLAYFVLGERLSRLQVTGGLLIVAGTLIVSLRFGSTRTSSSCALFCSCCAADWRRRFPA